MDRLSRVWRHIPGGARTPQRVRLRAIGITAVAAFLLAVFAPRAAAAPSVVGFGDSVSAGYGLSMAAEWPPWFLGQRFAAGAACSNTPQAYPCLFASAIGGSLATSANYSIQAASTLDVLNTELPTAEQQLPPDVRARVNAVTLTIGANDIRFDQCTTNELEANLPDSCLAGTIKRLQPSATLQAALNTVTGNVNQIIPRIERDFPNAVIYPTTYYQFVPGPVRRGSGPCDIYAIPAVAGLIDNLGGVSDIRDKIATARAYIRQLGVWMTRFHNRFAKVAAFIQGRLNNAIRNGLVGLSSTTPVVVVPLDKAFRGRDICSKRPWLFNLRAYVTVNGKSPVSTSTRCPFPMPPAGNPPTTVETSYSASTSFGPISLSAGFSTNCIPHPTVRGQQAIARAALAKYSAKIYYVPPCEKERFRPAGFLLTCDGSYATGMNWTQWGPTVAAGQGTAHRNTCVPSCAEGHYIAYRYQLRLSKPLFCAATGHYDYTVLGFRYPGPKPRGAPRSGSVPINVSCS